MSVENFNKYMEISKLLNTTWGTGSQKKSFPHSIKFSLRDDKLLVGSYAMIVNIPNDPVLMREMVQSYKQEGVDKLLVAVKDIKDKWDVANPDNKGKFTLLENTVTESVEYVSNSSYGRARQEVCFRLVCLFDIS